MARYTNALSTYAVSTNRESLDNVIYNISPTDTPLMNTIGKSKATARTFDWSVNSLAAVDPANYQEEGYVPTVAAYSPPARLSQFCQIMGKTASVTNSQIASDMAGARSAMALAMADRAAELKRDIETTISGNQAAVAGSEPTPRRMRGFEHFVQVGATGSGYASPASPTAAQTDGSTRAFSETLLVDALQNSFNVGGKPSVGILSGSNKRKLSSFAGRTTQSAEVKKDTVTASISFYESDFGVVHFHASRFNRSRTCLLVDPNLASLAYFRPFSWTDLATNGDAQAKMLTVELGLKVNAPEGHAKVADLS